MINVEMIQNMPDSDTKQYLMEGFMESLTPLLKEKVCVTRTAYPEYNEDEYTA